MDRSGRTRAVRRQLGDIVLDLRSLERWDSPRIREQIAEQLEALAQTLRIGDRP